MVSDMLFLAQAEERPLPHADRSGRPGRRGRALIDFYEALAEEKGVRIVRRARRVLLATA
jgi:two-component system heavy metal sensor histidine kinase CusS